MKERAPDENPENDSDIDELDEIARDLISAIERKDAKAVADALHAAYSVCEEGPREESQPEPHSYAASQEE